MIKKKLRNSDGEYRQAIKQGARPKNHGNREVSTGIYDKELANFCMNCKKANCPYGICDDFREFAKARKKGKSNG